MPKRLAKYCKIIPGPSEAGGGLGGFKFADFVSEIGCKSQGHKIEDSNLYIFEEATRIYQKCNIF